MDSLFDLVKRWDLNGEMPFTEKSFNLIHETIEFLHLKHYRQYVPTLESSCPEFMARLTSWLANVPDEKQKQLLFEFVPRLMFFGRDEFISLYRAAFRGPVTRWIIDELGLNVEDPDLSLKIASELHDHTWYCPITDSMPISEFYHVNRVGGVDYRPDFRSLAQFGNQQRVMEYMQQHRNAKGVLKPLRRIVLLEDFVGKGTQIGEATRFAASLSPSVHILVVPLVICPVGAETTRILCMQHQRQVCFQAIIELKPQDLILMNPPSKESPLESAVRQLVLDTYARVVGDNASDPRPYDPFGFGQTGAFVVLYSNTPANTLPMIHHQSNSWNALFPRSARIR